MNGGSGDNDSNHNKDVGYGRPPKSTQFAKGQSGNPRGRPKGTKNLSTILQKVSRQLVTVKICGRTVKMTKLEASTVQLANKAAGGDLKAIHELFHWNQAVQESDQSSSVNEVFEEKDQTVLANLLQRLEGFRASEQSPDTVPQETRKETSSNEAVAI